MVVKDYLSYIEICSNMIADHVFRYCYPIRKNRNFIMISKVLYPTLVLINEFMFTMLSKRMVSFVRIEHINDDMTIETCRRYIFNMINYLLIEGKLRKDQLYELVNYVISNFKNNYAYIEEKAYELIPYIKKPVKKFLHKVPKYKFRYAKKCLSNLELMINRLFSNIDTEISTNLYYVDFISIEDEKRFTDAMIICTASIFADRYIFPEFHYRTINVGHMHMLKSYTGRLCYRTYDLPFTLSPIIIDSQLLEGSSISLYSTFMDVLEGMDKEQFHKCVERGIKNHNIILVTNRADYIFDYWEITRDKISSLLYVISKQIKLSSIHSIEDYVRDLKMISEHKEIKNMLMREYNFITKHFKYGSIDTEREYMLAYMDI